MINQQPLVSVIVCTYNRQHYLVNCLRCLQKQTYSNYELIVIDNNSTDGTAQIVQQMIGVAYYCEQRQGVAYARNLGIEVSHGQYIAYIDDDEELEADWITNMLLAFELDELIAGANGPVLPVYEIEPPQWLPRGFWEWSNQQDIENPGQPYVFNRVFGTGNSMFKRDYLGDIRFRTDLGRRKQLLLSGEDTELVERLLQAGYKTAFVPRAPIYHMIGKERICFKWLIKRAFAEGMTEYYCRGDKILLRRLPKFFVDAVRVVISPLRFSKRFFAAKFLRFSQTLGIYYGFWHKITNIHG